MNGGIADVIIGVVTAALTFWGIAWGFHRQDKKDAKEREAKQDERHRQNQERLIGIATALRYNPLHIHTERSGNLTVDGIRYPPYNSEKP